jgi:hypothetical protein
MEVRSLISCERYATNIPTCSYIYVGLGLALFRGIDRVSIRSNYVRKLAHVLIVSFVCNFAYYFFNNQRSEGAMLEVLSSFTAWPRDHWSLYLTNVALNIFFQYQLDLRANQEQDQCIFPFSLRERELALNIF